MKNFEKFKTAEERAEAFRNFCEKAQIDCAKCPEFTQADHDDLCKLTKRGEIRVDELSMWLGDCEERRASNGK